MLLRIWILFSFLMTLVAFNSQPSKPLWDEKSTVASVLIALGEEPPKHFLPQNEQLAKTGEDLVKYGQTIGPDGKRTRHISKHYVCTTCHNLEQEDPDLRFSDPAARLTYVKAKGIPFLQGTTFKGIVNRESWYNDDYVKKYGDEKIQIAHEDLRASIQLCAIECSQGRPMEDWEIEAVLAYYWTLQFNLLDLGFSNGDYEQLNAEWDNPAQQEVLRQWIKGFYNQKSPAHFYDAPASKSKGYEGLVGNPAAGKDLYELSCLHCHKSGGVSHYILDDSELSFQHLKKMIPKDSHFSLYQIIAYGTYAIPGHRPYMPHYPEERMSKQQVEDLRAYIEARAID